MAANSGETGEAVAEAAESGWEAIRNDSSIQFEPIPDPEPRDPPSWLQDFFEALGRFFEPLGTMFGASWPVVKWVLIAGAAALLLYLLWALLGPVIQAGLKKATTAEEEWTPTEEEAVALLDDADRLAAAGQYDAATHLLLKRSVSQIADARPGLVEPSSTARELAALPALPGAARTAFATIADRVEHSLFALQRLGKDDWQAARSAYAEFALQSLAAEAS